MTGDVRGVLTEAVAAHRPYGLDCKCGRPINSDADWARHMADVLLALPGVAVVQLPQPDLIQGEKRWNDGNVWTGAPGRVRAYLGDARMTSLEARELAADLLAAAAVAEGLGGRW